MKVKRSNRLIKRYNRAVKKIIKALKRLRAMLERYDVSVPPLWKVELDNAEENFTSLIITSKDLEREKNED